MQEAYCSACVHINRSWLICREIKNFAYFSIQINKLIGPAYTPGVDGLLTGMNLYLKTKIPILLYQLEVPNPGIQTKEK
jgi:hypothetical protein